MILALDINSVRTGFAFGGPNDGAPKSGVWKLPGGEDLPRCCGVLARSISEMAKVIRPGIIAIEAPLLFSGADKAKQRNPRTSLTLLALYGAASGAAFQAGAQAKDAHVGTWRKYFISHGRLPGDEAKRLTLERCRLLGWPAENHDQAEAMGIWAWAMAGAYPRWAPRAPSKLGGNHHEDRILAG